MSISNILGILSLAVITLISHVGQAAAAHTYVLAYEGAINGDAAAIETSINDLFKDLDHAKGTTEVVHQRYPQTNIYTIEAYVEAISDQTTASVENFVRTHSEFTIGDVKIQLKPATQIVEFFSIEGFGLKSAGAKEESWGSFVRYRKFPSVSAYNSAIFQLGLSMGRGNETEILKAVAPMLNPVDARSFQEWLNAPAGQKMSRLHWDSHSFFVMEDGSFVSRLMAWHMDRSLTAPALSKIGNTQPLAGSN